VITKSWQHGARSDALQTNSLNSLGLVRSINIAAISQRLFKGANGLASAKRRTISDRSCSFPWN
jgi:hypothetical protein